MARYGLQRRHFESDFARYCAENGFSPGYECAAMLDRAARTHDSRTFALMAAIADKFLAVDEQNPQRELFVIDRRRERALQASNEASQEGDTAGAEVSAHQGEPEEIVQVIARTAGSAAAETLAREWMHGREERDVEPTACEELVAQSWAGTLFHDMDTDWSQDE